MSELSEVKKTKKVYQVGVEMICQAKKICRDWKKNDNENLTQDSE